MIVTLLRVDGAAEEAAADSLTLLFLVVAVLGLCGILRLRGEEAGACCMFDVLGVSGLSVGFFPHSLLIAA